MSSKISLIIQREYNQRVRKKSFIIVTILTPILLAALMITPTLIMRYGKDKTREIVVIDNNGGIASKVENNKSVEFKITDKNYKDAEKEFPEAYGFLIVGEDIFENPTSLQLYTRSSATVDVESNIAHQISSIIETERINQTNIEGLDSIMQSIKARASMQTFTISQGENGDSVDKSSSSALSMMVGMIGGFLIYMFVFMYGNMVMQGVIEEKNSRIIEVMVSSVKPFQLMMGKILGIAFVALTQIAIWIILFGGLTLLAQSLMAGGLDPSQVGDMAAMAAAQGMDPEAVSMISQISDPGYIFMLLGLYLLFLIGGYLLYSAMFAAVGSAVDDPQDVGQLQIPITIPLMLAILVLMSAMRSPDSGIAFWFSMIPFTSPIVMMARIPYGVPTWEILLSLVLLYATFVAMTWLSAKIYRVGIFMYGKKPTLKELIKWAKYKN